MEEEGGTLSDLNQADYEELMENTMIGLDSYLPENLSESNGLMNPNMINMLNGEETTLSMDEYKFIQEGGYTIPMVNFPPSEPQELCNTDYAGPLNFEVFVDPNVMKNPWEYSPLLNKIYIDMKHKFPINFSVKNQQSEESLFVRVMPMFEEDRYFQEMVFRCICHEQPQETTNVGISELVCQHIIRCDNSMAQYFGDKNQGRRLSIVIPLGKPQAGTDSVKEFFHFVCKNSCVGGMNRRPIQVIFTLENVHGAVLGRRVLCVRICSCPKRDREKEEQKREKHPLPHGKKRKIDKKPPADSTDLKAYTLPTILGKDNAIQLLKIYQAQMGHEIMKAKTGAHIFKKCYDEASARLNQILSE